MKNFRTELKWAAIFTLCHLAWFSLENLCGLHGKHLSRYPLLSLLIAIPGLAVYYFALKEKKQGFFNGKMSYMQGLMSGVILSILIGVLSPIATVISMSFISPDLSDMLIQEAVASGRMSQPAAESFYSLSSSISSGIFNAPIFGFLASAIVAFFVKSK